MLSGLFSKHHAAEPEGPRDSMTSIGSDAVVPGGPSPDSTLRSTSQSAPHEQTGFSHPSELGGDPSSGGGPAVGFVDEPVAAGTGGANVDRQPSEAIASDPTGIGKHVSGGDGPQAFSSEPTPNANHAHNPQPQTEHPSFPIPEHQPEYTRDTLPPLTGTDPQPAAMGNMPMPMPTPEANPASMNPSPLNHPKEFSAGSGYTEQTTNLSNAHVNQPNEFPGQNDQATGMAAGAAAAFGAGTAVGRVGSTASRRTGRDNVNGSTFGAGAAMASNAPPDVDPSVGSRRATADEELGAKDKAGIVKEEKHHGRQLSKIIKGEAKTEKAALQVATKELAEIQKIQKESVKEESISHTKHSRAISEAHKAEMQFLAAREVYDRAQTTVKATEEALETSRRHARETTEMLREKMEEVETLELHKQMDDRERAVKIKGLAGEVQEKRGLSRFL